MASPRTSKAARSLSSSPGAGKSVAKGRRRQRFALSLSLTLTAHVPTLYAMQPRGLLVTVFKIIDNELSSSANMRGESPCWLAPTRSLPCIHLQSTCGKEGPLGVGHSHIKRSVSKVPEIVARMSSMGGHRHREGARGARPALGMSCHTHLGMFLSDLSSPQQEPFSRLTSHV